MNATTLDYTTYHVQTPYSKQTEEYTDEMCMHALRYNMAEWALEKLYERYKRYAYSLAYRILNDSFLAEDVVQDVFFTLWQKAFFYHEQQGSVKSWLQAIVRNRAIDKMRSFAHRDAQCVQLHHLHEQDPTSTDCDVWEQVWDGQQAALIRQAMMQLPAEQCLVIELSYFYGYTHAEIAHQQQLPLGTVKGRMRLGLQKMKLLLQAYHIDMV